MSGDSGAGFNPFGGSASSKGNGSPSIAPAPSSAAALAASLLRPQLPGVVAPSRPGIQSAPVIPSGLGSQSSGPNPFGPDSSRPAAASAGATVGAGPSAASLAASYSAPSSFHYFPSLGNGPPLEVDVYLGDACPVPLPTVTTPEGRMGALAPSHIKGETPIFRDIDCYYRSPIGHRLMGTVSATTYSVTFNWTGGAGGGGVHAQASSSGGSSGTGSSSSSFSATAALLPGPMRHIHSSFFTAPVTFIRRIEKGTPRGKEAGSFFTVDIGFKDVRQWTLVFRDEGLADRVVGHLRMVAFPAKVDFLHCFEEAKAVGLKDGGVFNLPAMGLHASPMPTTLNTPMGVLPGWEVYNPYEELERIGVIGNNSSNSNSMATGQHNSNGRRGTASNNAWRVSDVNREYRFCPTYPSVLVFPERFPDAALRPLESFRSKARVPALTWQHPSNRATLWRCSQPRVGMGNNVCKEDELLLLAIRDASLAAAAAAGVSIGVGGGNSNGGGGGGGGGPIPLLIADCRPKANAMANKAGGWGYENYPSFSQLEFLGIHNIHAVRDSYKKLEALALSPSTSDIGWTSAVADSGWLHHVRSILGGALFVAESLHRRGQSVVVHCSDGWDRTAQVCGLVQLLLDPYSRTLKGLCSLVAKEWCSFGHKFHERCGHGDEKADVDGDFSPVFIQWLDAIWQLVRLFPHAFEFNERALLVIGHHLYSCRFGTFLFNCERERNENRLAHRTQSLWAYLLHGGPARTSCLVNHAYNPSLGDILLPHPSAVLRSVEVWSDWFLRWSPYPSMLPKPPPVSSYPQPQLASASASASASGPSQPPSAWWWSSSSRLERYPAGTYEYERVASVAVVTNAWDHWRRDSGRGGANSSAGKTAATPGSATVGGGAGARPAGRPSVVRDPLTGAIITPSSPSEEVAAGDAASALAGSERLVRGGILDDGSGDDTPSSPEARGALGSVTAGVAALLASAAPEDDPAIASSASSAIATDSFSRFVGGDLHAAAASALSVDALEGATTPAVTAAIAEAVEAASAASAAEPPASGPLVPLGEADELNEEDEGLDNEDDEGGGGPFGSHGGLSSDGDEGAGDTRATNSPAPAPSIGGYQDDD